MNFQKKTGMYSAKYLTISYHFLFAVKAIRIQNLQTREERIVEHMYEVTQ
jgi:hypothetical protein